MLHAQPVTKKMADFHLIKDLYQTAFPPREREPLSMLLSRAKQGTAQFNAYYDGDTFVGFSSAATQKDLTYVQYLAVAATGRSKGYGGQILQLIKEAHPQNRIFLNLELEDDTAKNAEQRKKRRVFYLRNGYTPADFNIMIGGNALELMTINGTCTADEVQAFFRKYYGFIIFKWLRIKLWSDVK